MAESNTANILVVGSTDLSRYVKGLKVGKEVIVSDSSGRGADGTMVLDIKASKYKLYVTFRPLTESEAEIVASAIDWTSASDGLETTFINPFTGEEETCYMYTGTPNFEYYRYSENLKIVNDLSVDFIEL